jgi:MoaA/NifB/PqqE/SkfB family radical SAM enzyme
MKQLGIIKIANLLLTRKCNLACSYCRISADMDYNKKPHIYPSKTYYFQKEKDTEYWINVVDRLYKHNKDIFLILYGGEPFLRKDLADIVRYCNTLGVAYTIISSCNEGIQPLIDKFFNDLNEPVLGFTASVDPGFYLTEDGDSTISDELHKANMGFKTLKRLIKENKVKDPVAEITVSNFNTKYLEETIKRLSDEGITSDITVLDISKNEWYDFSSVTNPELLVQKTPEIKEIFERLVNSTYLIHMKENLVNMIYDILPANLDCEFEKPGKWSNISIDSDGMLRMCLRIRGDKISLIEFDSLVQEDGDMLTYLQKILAKDKRDLCRGCSWTCALMSKLDSSGIINH